MHFIQHNSVQVLSIDYDNTNYILSFRLRAKPLRKLLLGINEYTILAHNENNNYCKSKHPKALSI